MEVKVVSTEIVKPSSPTADHRKTYKLCSIDQCMPRVYIPTFFFYQRNQEKEEEEEARSRQSQLLKLSLSRLLTFFYPFAGTITDNNFLCVICDDRGVPVTLANASFPLLDFLRQPDYGRLPDFFPEVLEKDPAGCPHVAIVQLTHFSCGGFALSAAVSHLVADASSTSFFLRSWAAMHRHDDGSFLPKPPIFIASSLFPPGERVPEEVRRGGSSIESLRKQVKVAKRRLVYGPAAVRALKEKAASPSVPNPTRAQVVSAHLAKCIMSASEGKLKSTVFSHAVNLRPRAEPPFPEELIGNLVWVAVMQQQVDAHVTEANLVKQMQEATSKINGDLVKRMSGAGADAVFHEMLNCSAVAPGSELIFFTSWCNMGLYGVDFGWGKPIWVTRTGGYASLVALMDTRPRDGVEALLLLDEALMVALEQTPDLLAYATFDQSHQV